MPPPLLCGPPYSPLSFLPLVGVDRRIFLSQASPWGTAVFPSPKPPPPWGRGTAVLPFFMPPPWGRGTAERRWKGQKTSLAPKPEPFPLGDRHIFLSQASPLGEGDRRTAVEGAKAPLASKT